MTNSKCLSNFFFTFKNCVNMFTSIDLLANHSHTLLLGLLGNRGKFDSILHFLQRIIKKFGLFNCAIQHTYKNYVFTHDFHAKVDVNVLTHFAGEPIFYVRMYYMYYCKVNRVFNLTEVFSSYFQKKNLMERPRKGL